MLKKVLDKVEEIYNKNNLPSISVVIIYGEEVVFKCINSDCDTIYQWASLTKVISSIIAIQGNTKQKIENLGCTVFEAITHTSKYEPYSGDFLEFLGYDRDFILSNIKPTSTQEKNYTNHVFSAGVYQAVPDFEDKYKEFLDFLDMKTAGLSDIPKETENVAMCTFQGKTSFVNTKSQLPAGGGYGSITDLSKLLKYLMKLDNFIMNKHAGYFEAGISSAIRWSKGLGIGVLCNSEIMISPALCDYAFLSTEEEFDSTLEKCKIFMSSSVCNYVHSSYDMILPKKYMCYENNTELYLSNNIIQLGHSKPAIIEDNYFHLSDANSNISYRVKIKRENKDISLKVKGEKYCYREIL